MINQQKAEELGFRIEFKTDSEWQHDNYFRCSYDGGKIWKHDQQIYNEVDEILRHQIGRFYIDEVLKPELKKGESLCGLCANQGKVGIVRYAGTVEGTEKVCREFYDEDGERYTKDVDVYCRYAQWKCDRCGDIVGSDYA